VGFEPGAFASSWYGVPALAGEGQDWQANGQGGGAPDRLKPGLRTRNSRMRPFEPEGTGLGGHLAESPIPCRVKGSLAK